MNKSSVNQMMRFAVPVALENLANQLIGMLIPALIGGISGSALAAVGMGNTVTALFSSCFSIMSIGGAVLLARAIGAKEQKEASKFAGQSVLMATALSVAFAVVFALTAVWVMRLLMPTAEQAMFSEAVLYLRYMMLSFPGLMVYTVGSALLRASGATRGPMVVTVALNVLLVSFSALFIRGMNLGLHGAGVAYALARTAAAALTVVMLLKHHGSFHLNWRDLVRPQMEVWRRIFRIGLPASMETSMVQVGYLVGNALAVGLGSHEATVFQVVNTVYGFAGYPQSICSAILVSFVGQMVGAGMFREAKRTARQVLAAGLGITVVLGVILVAFNRTFSGMYTSDPQVLEECVRLSWVILVSNIPAMMINGTDPGLRAGGDVRFVMIYTVIGVWAIRVPLTWLFCYPMDMGVLGVFLANIVSLSLRAVCGQIRFLSGRWIHKNV